MPAHKWGLNKIGCLILWQSKGKHTFHSVFLTEINVMKRKKSVFLLNAILMIPNISIRPTLDELQDALVQAGKTVTGVSKGVAQWNSRELHSQFNRKTSQKNINLDERAQRRKLYRLLSEERPQMPHMSKSFYNYVMDNKEVVKTLSLLGNCCRNVKNDLLNWIKNWKPFHFLWKNDKTIRQLLDYTLIDFEATLRYLTELDQNLSLVPDMEYFGQCVVLSTEKLKLGLLCEIKAYTHKLGQAMKKKYKREMDYVYAVINEMDRKLDRPIRDLDDVRMIMDTLGKIREQEVDMDLKIDPIEEAFNVMLKYEIQVEHEHMELVDNLRDTWQKLKSRALSTHCKLLEMQPTFQMELKTNLDRFKQDKNDYVNEYKTSGPMQPGLTPREASDKLILFQVSYHCLFFVSVIQTIL